MDNLNFENFDQLLPQFHLRGINFLLEMGLFADHDESSKVIDGAKNLGSLVCINCCNECKEELSRKTTHQRKHEAEKVASFY